LLHVCQSHWKGRELGSFSTNSMTSILCVFFEVFSRARTYSVDWRSSSVQDQSSLGVARSKPNILIQVFQKLSVLELNMFRQREFVFGKIVVDQCTARLELTPDKARGKKASRAKLFQWNCDLDFVVTVETKEWKLRRHK